MRRATTSLLGFALVSLLCACGPAAQGPPPAGGSAAKADDPVEVCKAMFARQYECRATFIPALVDMRVKYDAPKGIAAHAAKPGGRDELIAMAQKEYDTDGVDPKRSETCKAVAPQFPPEVVAAAKKCAAAADCATLIACVTPLQEGRIKMQAAQEAKPAK
jgi:hypothetical protein